MSSYVVIEDAFGPIVSYPAPNETYYCRVAERQFSFMFNDVGLSQIRDEDNGLELPLDGDLAEVILQKVEGFK